MAAWEGPTAAAVAEGKQLYITLVGGGNSTHCFAPLACSQGHRVAILTRRPQDWATDGVEVVNDDTQWLPITKMEGKPETITSDPAQCIPKSDIIIIAGVPIHHNPALLRQIKPHLPTNKKVFIGSICSYGGFDWVAHRELDHGSAIEVNQAEATMGYQRSKARNQGSIRLG